MENSFPIKDTALEIFIVKLQKIMKDDNFKNDMNTWIKKREYLIDYIMPILYKF